MLLFCSVTLGTPVILTKPSESGRKIPPKEESAIRLMK